MFSNVLPSDPHDEPGLYPELPQHDLRMQKANEVPAALNAEVVHYRGVVGIPAAIPLGGVGGWWIIASKRLDSKIKKHQEIVTLAIAKRDNVQTSA